MTKFTLLVIDNVLITIIGLFWSKQGRFVVL
jgi:hypothetical protein